jgi:hypothetical protein
VTVIFKDEFISSCECDCRSLLCECSVRFCLCFINFLVALLYSAITHSHHSTTPHSKHSAAPPKTTYILKRNFTNTVAVLMITDTFWMSTQHTVHFSFSLHSCKTTNYCSTWSSPCLLYFSQWMDWFLLCFPFSSSYGCRPLPISPLPQDFEAVFHISQSS